MMQKKQNKQNNNKKLVFNYCVLCALGHSSEVGQNTIQGCHGQGKVREKYKKFKVREKSGNF